jgi:hypothetical protein
MPVFLSLVFLFGVVLATSMEFHSSLSLLFVISLYIYIFFVIPFFVKFDFSGIFLSHAKGCNLDFLKTPS